MRLIRQASQTTIHVIFVTIAIFEKKRFKFQSHVCNRCHNLVIESVNLEDIATLNIKGADFLGLSTSESMTLIQNTDLTEKSGTLQNIQIHYHL